MKKRSLKKLNLHRETLLSMEDLRLAFGGVVKTVDATQCVTNCYSCQLTQNTNCC